MKSAVFALLLLPRWVAAEPIRLRLDQILGFAQRNPGISAAHEQVAAIEARLQEARRAWIPQGTFSALVAPAPEVRCEPSEALCVHTSTVDVNQSSIAGIFTRLELKLAAPVYTFGKIDNAKRAAEAGLKATEADLRRASQEIVYDVTRAYYGLKLARDILFTIEEGQEHLKKAIARVGEELQTGQGDTTESDQLRLQVLEAEIDARHGEARKLADTTLAVLHTLATDAPAGFDIDEGPLEARNVTLESVAHYIDLAQQHRPEVRALHAGVELRHALEEVEWGRFWPDLALVGQLAWAQAPTVDDPDTLFASDPFNSFTLGVGALATLQLDHPLKLARYRRAQAETREIEQRRSQALAGIGLEVKKTVADLEEARSRMAATARGEKAARSWLVATSQNLILGLVEPKELTDSLLAFFTLRLRYLQAVYDVDAGIAALERAAGVRSILPSATRP